MKNMILCVLVFLLSAYSPSGVIAHTNETEPSTERAHLLNEHTYLLYKQINFTPGEELNFDVFRLAYHGYLNLKNEGKLHRNLLTICDFSLESTRNRLWIIDLDKKEVVFHTLVAHGQKSGENFATAFSNKMNSHQSSIGFYITGEPYQGKHGLSLRLHGMDPQYNSAALERGIVVHGADYVAEDFIQNHRRLGRSWGCPAVPNKLSQPIIETIQNGSCLFVYYPDQKYLSSSTWINRAPRTNGMQLAIDTTASFLEHGNLPVTTPRL